MKLNKILILEDEIIIGLDLKEILEAEGYEVVLVHSYEDANKQVKTLKPQLMICDINLGSKLTGIDFAKEAKLHLPFLEIIYVTAFTNQTVIEQAQETEPLNYIVKPWNEEQIKVTISIAFKYIREKAEQNSCLKSLSLSEYKILELIAKQKKSKEIGELLFISEKTVRNHRYNMIKKLNLPNDNNSLLKWAITHFNK
jgi:DNA-binding NarL/FixJ family response regulator